MSCMARTNLIDAVRVENAFAIKGNTTGSKGFRTGGNENVFGTEGFNGIVRFCHKEGFGSTRIGKGGKPLHITDAGKIELSRDILGIRRGQVCTGMNNLVPNTIHNNIK